MLSPATAKLLGDFSYLSLKERSDFLQELRRQGLMDPHLSMSPSEKAAPANKDSTLHDVPDRFLQMLAKILAPTRLAPSLSEWYSMNFAQKDTVRRIWSRIIDSLLPKVSAETDNEAARSPPISPSMAPNAYLDYMEALQASKVSLPPPLPPRPSNLSLASSHSSDRWVEDEEPHDEQFGECQDG